MPWQSFLLQEQTRQRPMPLNPPNDPILLSVFVVVVVALILVILILVALVILLATGRLQFTNHRLSRKQPSEDEVRAGEGLDQPEVKQAKEKVVELPDISLTPLERQVLEYVLSGHKVRQADLPQELGISKSKVSELLGGLEERRIIQRVKAGRTLEIRYIYTPSTTEED